MDTVRWVEPESNSIQSKLARSHDIDHETGSNLGWNSELNPSEM